MFHAVGAGVLGPLRILMITMMNLMSYDNLRMYVIPIFMGLVWVLSFVISYFSSQNLSEIWDYVLRLSAAFNIVLFFELLLMVWDIKLSLNGYYLERDKLFNLQSLTVPFFILAAPFGFIAFSGGWWLIIYVAVLFCAKTTMHYTVVAVDKFKIPIGYGPLIAI